jgi:predicted GNAT family acetyltransferase
VNEPTVRDNPAERRYELLVDGSLVGRLDYRLRPSGVALIHTVIEPSQRGHGLGHRLVEGALRDLSARGLAVIPVCPFVSAVQRGA